MKKKPGPKRKELKGYTEEGLAFVYYELGTTAKEIAEKAKVSESTIRRRLKEWKNKGHYFK